MEVRHVGVFAIRCGWSSDSGADVFRFWRGRSFDSDGIGSPTRTRGSSPDCSGSWTERSGSRTDCSGFRVELRFPPRALQRGFAKPCSGAETALATGRVSPEALQGAWREPGGVFCVSPARGIAEDSQGVRCVSPAISAARQFRVSALRRNFERQPPDA